VNTIANWVNELSKWQKGLERQFIVYNINDCNQTARPYQVNSWMRNDGLLLVSDNVFKIIGKNDKCEIQPDLIVLDEVHTMLKNSSTVIYNALKTIRTPRRIGTLWSLFTGKTNLTPVHCRIDGYAIPEQLDGVLPPDPLY
jgi:SNF2 family DNA or RNA helicase